MEKNTYILDTKHIPFFSKKEFMLSKCFLYFNRIRRSYLYQHFLIPLMNKFGKTEDQIIKSFFYYNTNINTYSNDIYADIDSRFSLLMNYLLPGTWFSHRLQAYINVVKQYQSISDIGFGIPFLFLYNFINNTSTKNNITINYFDKNDSAFYFSKVFLTYLKEIRPDIYKNAKVNWTKYDLDDYRVTSSNIKECSFQRHLVVALDCLEHAISPDNALEILIRNFPYSDFFIGLPIGPIIPQHTIQFKTEEEAIFFVIKSGLKIKKAELISTNWNADLIGNKEFKGSLFIEAYF